MHLFIKKLLVPAQVTKAEWNNHATFTSNKLTLTHKPKGNTNFRLVCQ